MVNNYYTLRALAREWADDLVGCTVVDAFSQVKNELTLALDGGAADAQWTLRCSVQRPLIYLFRSRGIHKARRNVATLFEDAFGARVADVDIAFRDRLVTLALSDGSRFVWQLFGARANVFWVRPDGTIGEAFRNDAKHAGTDAPTPRAAPMPDTFADFEARWRTNRNKTRQAVQSAMALFGRDLARETLHRAGVTTDAPADCSEAERRALFEAAQSIRADLDAPTPVVYGAGQFPDAFALIPLQHRAEEPAERFDTVSAAVRVYVRRALAERHYHRLYDPLETALAEAAEHARRSAEHMLEELSSTSRAARYERWAHLLMAQPDAVPDGAEDVTLPNLFADAFTDGESVTIPLDPARSAIENAEHYYDRARRTRRSREEAEARLDDTLARAEKAEALLKAIREIDTLKGIKHFRKQHDAALAPFLDTQRADLDRFPFRRFDLGSGYEVWVGKNARQNQDLTFHVAQKYDLWMHARGVPGSHTILHLPNRDAQPGKHRKHVAARIAAYYSKARGSGLVPVMMTPRKYVRSPKGAAPGQVTVQREEVLLVEPGLPE